MKNRISFCVNACKKSTFRFIGGLQNVLRFLTDHLRRGGSGAGYHYYIRKDGSIKSLRPVDKSGAHARGYNAHSIGVCYEGGLDTNGHSCDTRTTF